MHKQVFIKEKSLPQLDKKKQKSSVGIDGFKKAVKQTKRAKPAPPPKETPEPLVADNSLLSTILEAQDPNAFVIQPPDKKSKNYLESKIYFWETSTCIKIKVSTIDITYDVIRHIMTLYRQSPFEKQKPLKYTDPARYSLWLIDEFDRRNKYRPDDEFGPRPFREPIGDFKMLAFVEVKNFKPPTNSNANVLDE